MVGAMRDSLRTDRLKKKVQRTERETSKAVVVDLPKPRPSSGPPSEYILGGTTRLPPSEFMAVESTADFIVPL